MYFAIGFYIAFIIIPFLLVIPLRYAYLKISFEPFRTKYGDCNTLIEIPFINPKDLGQKDTITGIGIWFFGYIVYAVVVFVISIIAFVLWPLLFALIPAIFLYKSNKQ